VDVQSILVVVAAAIGIPASLFRLWWIWWQGDCHACGLRHNACTCPADDHMMRPKR
jgi:hypothetical protein